MAPSSGRSPPEQSRLTHPAAPQERCTEVAADLAAAEAQLAAANDVAHMRGAGKCFRAMLWALTNFSVSASRGGPNLLLAPVAVECLCGGMNCERCC